MPRLILPLLLVASSIAAQAPLFELLDNPIPNARLVMAAGDVDGDLDQDLLVPFGILVNDGHGRFTRVAAPWVPIGSSRSRLVDLNGDGMADLVSVIPLGTGTHVRIDLNVGLYTFTTTQLLTSGTTPPAFIPHGIATGDVDGDGDVDILAGTWIGAPAPVATPPVLWLNDGSGGFSPAPVGAVPGVPLPGGIVLLHDLDADGDLDALFAPTDPIGPSAVFMAVNNGGTFTLLPGTLTSGWVSSMAVGMLNNDGLPDLIVGQVWNAKVFMNSASGFLAATVTPLPPPYTTSYPVHVPVDVNGDGVDEILEATYGRRVALRPVLAGGALGPPIQSWVDLDLKDYYFDPVASDLDGDGDRDVVARTEAESLPLMNTGGGTLVRLGGHVTNLWLASDQWAGDLDADGDVDILGYNPAKLVTTAINDGEGYFTPGPTTALPPTPAQSGYSLRTFDRDGDGDLDIYAMFQIYGAGVSGPDVVFDNTGGTFTQALTVPSTGDGRSFQAGDFDGDGDLDLVISRWAGASTPVGPMSFIRNLGPAGFAAPVPIGAPGFTFELDVADFDGNGTLDVFQTSAPHASGGSNPSVFYKNSGNGVFAASVQGAISGHFTAVGDLNGDALPDLVVDGTVHLNTGAGFVAGPLLPAPLLGPASLVDVDLDGDLDLVETPATVMLNAGGAVFGLPQSYLPRWPASPSNPNIPESAIVDVDRDGDPDIVAPGPIVFLNKARQIAHGSVPRPGRPASIDLYGTPGGAWFLYLANGTASIRIPPWGIVMIDPASAQLAAMGTFTGPAAAFPGTASFGVTLPNNPALVGWTTYWQAIDAVQTRFTNRLTITVMGY